MMARIGFRVLLAAGLLLLSGALYWVQIGVFHRPVDTEFYLLQDFAFVPVQVLLVTLVVNELLKARERSALQHKLNMVIGAFFTEIGRVLLRYFAEFDTRIEEVRELASVRASWTNRDFGSARKTLIDHDYNMDCRCADLAALRDLLVGSRSFLLDLVGNPNLMEHESFTELLWAVSHLTEELEFRSDLNNLPDSDYDHLAADMRRAYTRLITEWLSYVQHLKQDYPYMFSFVVRMSPFEPGASPVVRDE